jgi:hypothetical protein
MASYLLPVRAVAEGWSTFTVSMIATGYAIAFTSACIITPRLGQGSVMCGCSAC